MSSVKQVRVCEHCHAEFGRGRKRKFCYMCLPEHKSIGHMDYVRRYQDLMQKVNAAQRAVAQRLAECAECGAGFVVRPRDWANRSFCYTCLPSIKDVGREQYARMRARLMPRVRETPCLECGNMVPTPKRLCGPECRASRAKKWRQSRNRRVRLVGKGKYVASDIFARDGYICWLCHKPLEMHRLAGHPKAPTIDHVISLAAGGTDDATNVRAAHHSCNSAKRDRDVQHQLMLVG